MSDIKSQLSAALLKYQTAVSNAAEEFREEKKRINAASGQPSERRAKRLAKLKADELGLNQLIPFYEQLLQNPEKLLPEYAASIIGKLPKLRAELVEVKAGIAELEKL